MRIFTILLFSSLCWGQVSEPVTGTLTIPSGIFELPLIFQAPLLRTGNIITCPGCGSGSGGGTTSNLLPWQPAAQATPPPVATWTQVNGGGNGLFYDVRNGVEINTVSGTAQKYLTLSAPMGNWTLTGHINAQCATNDFSNYGLMVGDSGGKATKWEISFKGNASNGALATEHWNTPTGPATNPYLNTAAGVTADTWLRVRYDGTNLLFYASPTGTDETTFQQFAAELATSYLSSISTVGFVATSQNTGQPCIAVLNYWALSQP